MLPSMRSVALLLALAALPSPCASSRLAAAVASKKSLRPVGDTLVQPLRFDQRLLVCNAYPSRSPVVIKKNEQAMLVDGSQPLAFGECRELSSRVQQHDRLVLGLRDNELHGTFEVGELPTTDAVLLLVLEKREGSVLMGFQSFAFASHSDDKDAQLAVIDTFRGNSSAPHLKMEDHVTGKEKQTVSKRIEQLNFNRVYSVEEGNYDASIGDKGRGSAELEQQLELNTKRSLHLTRNQNYVVLRIGGDGPEFPESLVVYPKSPLQSGARGLGASCLAVVLAALGALRL